MVSHAGMAWLAETADLAGLTAALSTAMASVPQRRHDPGRTLAQMILALADGATCLSDLAALRAQRSMFGPVASEATVWRTFDQIGPVELRGIATARAAARERAWSAGAGPASEDVIIDFDATLINTKADKQDARPNYERGYGYHPRAGHDRGDRRGPHRQAAPGQRRIEHRGRPRHRSGRRARTAPRRLACRSR